MRNLRKVLPVVGKTVLVLATLAFLSSLGGAMLYAFWVLVPLHWLAARDSGPYATAGWAFLAGLSLFEVGWMLTYMVTGEEVVGAVVGAAAGIAVMAVFARRGANRAAGRAARRTTDGLPAT